jgi:hypothetical protein
LAYAITQGKGMGDGRAPSRGFLTTSRKFMGRYGQFGNVRFGSLAERLGVSI